MTALVQEGPDLLDLLAEAEANAPQPGLAEVIPLPARPDMEALGDVLGGDLMSALTGLFEQMEWAEEEIGAAQRRHPARRDLLYHSFSLLTPTADLMTTEFVCRSHCRELLERVASGQDTRPGTAAEVVLACSAASTVAPLTHTAAGLYCRMWQAARFPVADPWDVAREHYEGLSASEIDDLEREARRKLAVPDRKPGRIECRGMHHGDPRVLHRAGRYPEGAVTMGDLTGNRPVPAGPSLIRLAQRYALYLPPGVRLSEATRQQLCQAVADGRAAGADEEV